MKTRFTLSHCSKFFAILFLLLGSLSLEAQLTGNQVVVSKCYTGPTIPFTNTTGTQMPSVLFTAGDFPNANYRVVDVKVEIVWSKSDLNSCTPPTGIAANLQDVGFMIQGPTGGQRFLAASSLTGGFPATGPTTNTFSGNFPGSTNGILSDTVVFSDGFPNGVPSPVVPGRDTIQPNNDSLNFYCGMDPTAFGGNWSVGGIDDSPSAGPALCIHSYCITITACEHSTLEVNCLATPNVALDPTTGTHAFEFIDVDSMSDVSCLVKSITFSPTNVNCSNIGTPVPVTMTIRDHLDSVQSCVSNVNVVDATPPIIPYCAMPFGTTHSTLYLDAAGQATFLADSVFMTDNCGPIIKTVRPLFAGPWSPSVDFSCVTGPQQFWVRGEDGNGNMDSCRVIVDVIDTIPPTAVCGQDTAYVGNGAVTMPAINLDAGSFDVCPPITGRWINVFNGPDPIYTCADLGTDTVMLIVRDNSNNLDTCHNAVVVVLDTSAPTAICQNVNVYLNGAGNGTLTATEVNNGSIDTCSIDSIDINGVASVNYNCSHLNSTQQVTLHVFDGSGNTDSCTAQVTVLDTFPPTAICRNFTIYTDAAGVATLVADSLNNNSVDVCTGSDLSFLINGSQTANFSCADIATNPNSVTLTVLDSFGNSSTCNSNVTVLDTIDPSPVCASPTVFLNGAGLATVTNTQLDGGSTDNCTVANTYVNVVGITSANYTCAAIFTPQNATLIVQDQSGNTATCNTTVNVVDTVSPTALCESSYTAVLDGSGNVTVTPTNIDSSSTDNCNLVQYLINGSSSQTYTCADIGSVVAVLTVRDSSGNTGNCNATINVVDNTPPTASCQVTTVFLDGAGTAAITPNDVLVFPATGDNCGSVTTSFQGGGSNIIYDCDSIGPHTVGVVVMDASGNTATCQTTVTVRDTVDPNASCRPVPYTVQLDASGNGFVVPTNVNNGSSDVCGIDTMLVNGVDSFFYTCASIGNTAVTLSVLDASGNQSTCVAQVIVDDNFPPVAVCHDTILYLDATGVVTAFPTDIDAGSSDNCGFTMTINNLPSVNYNCNQIGVNSAQLVVTDNAGNTTQCSANITVEDTITPTANCIAPASLTIYLDNTCFASVPASTFNNGSTDNCSGSLTYSVGGLPNATFTSANLATNPNPVMLTVCDGSSNCATCNTTVIVRDSTPPTMVCRPDTVQLDGTGNAFIIPNDVNNGSSDNCSVPAYTVNGGPVVNYTCADIGSNPVTLTGTDASGNAASCNTTVEVQDNTAPNASCNGSVTVLLDAFTSTGTLLVGQVDAGSSDNCSITNYTLSRTLFNCGDIPNNTHTVTMVVTDQSGNQDSCTTQVTVQDTVPPVASCVPGPVSLVLDGGGNGSITPADINNGSTDNCAIQSMTLNQSNFTCSDIGSNVITLTVTDSSGNSSNCNTTVNVSDTTSPQPFCTSPTVFVDANGSVTIAATDLAPGSFDNCSIDTMLVNGQDSVSFTCTDLGPNNVTVFMSDPSSNTATCPSTITVSDNTAPTANCVTGPIALFLDNTGNATLTPAQVDSNSTDNCSIAGTSISQSNYTCADIVNNPNTVTLTVTDQSGNADNCNTTVNVIDTVGPTMMCQSVTVNIHLSPGGVATVTAPMFDAGTADACGIQSLTFRRYNFTGASQLVSCADIGSHPVTLIAQDANGNVDSCTTQLTVLDSVAPTINCDTITISLDALGDAFVTEATPNLYTMSDACGTPTLTLNGTDTVRFSCLNVGPNTVTLVATDGSGNSSACNALVNVEDNTPPSISCVGSTQFLDANGLLAIDPAWITGSATDACGIDTSFTTPDTMTCAQVGPFNSVTLTVVDVNGNSSTCNANLNVQDTIPPTMVCRDTTVCLSSSGFVNVFAADVDGGTTDACGLSPTQTINGSNNVIYTCADLGAQPIILERQDVNGNADTCHATVTVLDCIAPTANCQNVSASLQSNGLVTVYAVDIDNGSFDDCAIDSSTFQINGQDSLTYSCNFLGTPDTVLFTVADFSGNLDTCIAVITIQDNMEPVASCGGPYNVNLSSTNPGRVIIQAITLNNNSTDNCTISNYLINGQSSDTFFCADAGSNIAVLTVVDNSGNTDTCQAIVNVNDNTPPNIQCQSGIINLVLDSTGIVTFPATALLVAQSDNCGIDSVYNVNNGQDTLIFTCANVGGNTQVPLQAVDFSGNTSNQCIAIVNISDNSPPEAICPTQPVPVYLTASGNVWVQPQQIDSASNDNCGIEFWQIEGQDSLLRFCSHIGQFPQVTLTVIDSSGAQDVCTATLEVLDTIPPVAQCSTFTANLGPQGTAIVSPQQIDSASTDNCGQFSLTYLINGQAQDTFDCSDVGSNTLATLTVTDQYGNASTCQANIDVVDNINPNVNCLSNQTFYLGTNGQVTVNPQQLISGTPSDNCNIVNYYINGQTDSTFNCAQTGVLFQMQIMVEDQSGNTDVCNATFRIRDTIPPTDNCVPNLNLSLGVSGDTTITGAALNLSNIDNCSIVDTLINGQNQVTYTCDSVGTTTAYLTLVDASNNTSVCATTVTVSDNTDPTMVCQDTLPIQLNLQGIAVVQAQALDNGSFDNCNISSYSINNMAMDTFDCTNVGYNTVFLVVTDVNSNSDQCPVVLDIEDNQPPTANCQNIDAYLNASGVVSVDVEDDIDNNSTDNCGIASILFVGGGTDTVFTCVDTGITHIVSMVVTDVNGNSDTCQATITVRDTIAPTVSCKGVIVNLTDDSTVVLQTIPGVQYSTIFGANDNCGIDSIFVSPDTITCTDIGDLIFTVTVIDGSGNMGTCQDTARVTLDQPVIVQMDTVLCEGDSLTLLGNDPGNGNNYDYQWLNSNGPITGNPNTIDTTIVVTIADEGHIVFTISEPGGGCPASDSFYLDVNEVQPPVLAGLAPCAGDSTTINLVNSGTYVGNTITYQWFFNGNPIAGNNFDSLVIPNMTAVDSGTYSMSIVVSQGPATCSDSSALGFTIDVLDLPEAPIPTANVPCEGDTLTLFNNAPGFVYNWDGPGGFISSDADPIRLNAVQAFGGIYTLTITDGNNCSNTGTVNVAISPTPPQPNLFYTQPLCLGDLLELQDTSVYPVTPVQYYWEDPAGNIDTTSLGQLFLSGAAAGDYMLTVSMNGCPSNTGDTSTIIYEVVPTGADDFFSIEFKDSLSPFAGNIVNNDNPNPSGFIITIIDSTDGGAVTNFGDGTIKYVPRSGFFGTDTMYYTLCDAQCPNSCDTMQVLIEVTTDFECFIPQGISPNGDGINDQLIVRCRNDYPNARMMVFSRWGTQVYDGPPTGWNGQFNGMDLPDGTYFYQLDLGESPNAEPGDAAVEGLNGNVYTGFIMIQR